MMTMLFRDDLPSPGKGRLAAMGKLALVALPLLMSAVTTTYPSVAKPMAPVQPHERDATVARMDPPWTWAEKYYFTS